MAGQELVVPTWHMCIASLIRHTSSLGLSSGICLGTVSYNGQLLAQKKTRLKRLYVALDGLASRVLYLGLISKAGPICFHRNIRLHLAKWIL